MSTETIRQNYYEILDLKENATQQEIFLAYEKAKKTYGIENKAISSVFSSEEAAELRNLIEEAYEVLRNDNYRNVYEKRMLANTFSKDEMTAEAIKSASQEIFKRAEVPVITTAVSAQTTVITSENDFTSEAPVINPQFEAELASKKEWTGDDLKQVREYRKLSFDELTDITKINPWYIAALEKMDPANLPVEVFVRGYVLQVAKALGLKEKAVADSYMRQFRKKIEN
jgi:curved DNA-binding protein CbpA